MDNDGLLGMMALVFVTLVIIVILEVEGYIHLF